MKIPFLKQGDNLEKEEIAKLEIKKIKVNPFQPRQEFKKSEIEELAESIKNFGLIQPIIVRKNNDVYELIAGERRLRAAKQLNKKVIPTIIKDLTDQEIAEIALIENIQRKDLNFLEEARAYKKLIEEFDLTQKELAERVSKSQSTIANKLRLFNLDPKVRKELIGKKLSERHGRALLKVNSVEKQLSIIEQICKKNLNVRESEKLIKKIEENKTGKRKKNKKIKHLSDDLRLYANSLEKRIDEIKDSGIEIEIDRNDGKDSIEYYIKLSK